ncbi:uncharacterized protein LOC113346031 isoform X2 [Papaver somniferum]|uniref:uncharacterized protein LOC113345560 isoform X2 n=1 Tax=Papaver somniferum TaxID=3469 RepID=UPI000E702D33|nr:uncharacterized protein LOC113345560 isoform X2 [Papaver somniferum]XP_026445119.1 uncharacterized protein LOC113345570 isoform X2 [Papaver somniferum]XP_026445428.1 uncharacterized protein LOC113346031 isoform X2 [Papaver somniferum]
MMFFRSKIFSSRSITNARFYSRSYPGGSNRNKPIILVGVPSSKSVIKQLKEINSTLKETQSYSRETMVALQGLAKESTNRYAKWLWVTATLATVSGVTVIEFIPGDLMKYPYNVFAGNRKEDEEASEEMDTKSESKSNGAAGNTGGPKISPKPAESKSDCASGNIGGPTMTSTPTEARSMKSAQVAPKPAASKSDG